MLRRAAKRTLDDPCRGRGIRYVHVLQPTLRVKGSKAPTKDERAILDDSAPHEEVDAGYARLRELGRRLADEGVEFFDATELFRDTTETVYIDPVHFNARGKSMLADFLSEAVRTSLVESPPLR